MKKDIYRSFIHHYIMDISHVDICCGLAWGDEAKGKIVSQFAKSGKYDFICRWAGGNNAGHTVYINSIKYKTHLIPCGIFYDIPSIIGPDCVVNIKSFFEEVEYLKQNGFNTSLIKISPKAHIVTDKHIEDDIKELKQKQGTTARGIAPCYSDKYKRVGKRASEYADLSYFLWDEKLHGTVLCEGAQGFWLDINYGNYPYVTSSTTLPYGACSLGFSPKLINEIYGAAKIYDTRSGIDTDFPETLFDDEELNKIGEIGKEFGVTTNRRRKVNWLNIGKLIKAINVTGTTSLIISKVDVLEEVKIFKLIDMEKEIIQFENLDQMKYYIENIIKKECANITSILFSNSPYEINDNNKNFFNATI